MGNAGILVRTLTEAPLDKPPRRIVEIGAGDGSLMLKIARRMRPVWGAAVDLKLVDRQDLLSSKTAAGFRALGWTVECLQTDLFQWLELAPDVDVIVANLFLHHFNDPDLRTLFTAAADKARLLAACEPRRFARPWLAAELLRLIGCSAVTRHDAALSIEAGFSGNELSALWPQRNGWQLRERNAGLFSHCFCAIRDQPARRVMPVIA
jgi:hypothetical protein